MQWQNIGGRVLVRVVIVGCFALTLAACGRKSALDPPPTSAAPAAPATSQEGQPAGAPAQAEAEAPPVRQNRGFILDPLLR